jgi:hypothetical protein
MITTSWLRSIAFRLGADCIRATVERIGLKTLRLGTGAASQTAAIKHSDFQTVPSTIVKVPNLNYDRAANH